MKQLIEFILGPWVKYQRNRAFKKKMAEMKKRDPFIYK